MKYSHIIITSWEEAESIRKIIECRCDELHNTALMIVHCNPTNEQIHQLARQGIVLEHLRESTSLQRLSAVTLGNEG